MFYNFYTEVFAFLLVIGRGLCFFGVIVFRVAWEIFGFICEGCVEDTSPMLLRFFVRLAESSLVLDLEVIDMFSLLVLCLLVADIGVVGRLSSLIFEVELKFYGRLDLGVVVKNWFNLLALVFLTPGDFCVSVFRIILGTSGLRCSLKRLVFVLIYYFKVAFALFCFEGTVFVDR